MREKAPSWLDNLEKQLDDAQHWPPRDGSPVTVPVSPDDLRTLIALARGAIGRSN
jgi:hypothetical protein